jgi:RNA polymerase sigma-70 factor (ECF subfamily)
MASPMTSEQAPIDSLLQRLKGGDQAALGELFSHYRERLWRMVDFRLDHRLGGRVSASDVLQEAYIDAAKRIKHYFARPSMSFFVWLRMIASQRLVDIHREHLGAQMRDAKQEVSIHGGVGSATSTSMAIHLVDNLTSPTQAVQRAEMHAIVEEALNGMDPIDREVLALRHFEELSNKEVAEVLGLEIAAASKRYVRAIKRLKNILVETCDGLNE